MSEEMTNPMEEWLQSYTKASTRKMSRIRFDKYLKWTNKSPQQLIDEFDNKKAKKSILAFQNFLLDEKKLSGATTKATVGAVRAFYTFHCEPIRGLKGKIVKGGARGRGRKFHVFSTTDLKKMYHIANTRDKAILACASSLGWEVSEIQKMEREEFENLVKRARSENLEFIDFWTIRQKEGENRLGILTPIALDSLERWLEKTEGSKSKWLWSNGNGDKPLTVDSFNDIMKSLAKEANIVTTGTIRFHGIRGWLMSTLSYAGLGEFEVKIVMGKSIPSSDSVYLEHLRKMVIEKVKMAYPQHLSLVAYSNGQTKIETLEEALDLTFKVMKALIKKHGISIDSLSLTTAELDLLKMRLGIKPAKKAKKPKDA